MDSKLFLKESVLPVTLFCSALMFSPVGIAQVNAATNVVLYFPEKGCHLGTNRSDNET